MAGQKKGAKKRTLKLTRADDDDDVDGTALFARSLAMSGDSKRLRTTNPEVCARVDVGGGSARIDWTTHFDPMVADSFTPAHPVKPRRYANSVSFTIITPFLPADVLVGRNTLGMG